MLYATNRFPGDGMTTQYEISFVGGYLDRAHVKAYVEGADFVRTPIFISPINFLGTNTIKGFPVVPVGSTLVVYRDTPKKPIVDFVNGSRLTEANLDTATRQGTFVAAEGADALSPSGLAGVLDQLGGLAVAANMSSVQAGVYAGQASASAATAEGSATSAATDAAAALNSKNLANNAASAASSRADMASQDAATVAANVTTATTAAAGAATAFAQAAALLGVGIGTSYVDPEGDLIMTYVPPVTSVYIDVDGNLSLDY